VLGGDEYALPIGQVREVIAYTEPRSIASRVSWVRGVINLRGTILPVCDLSARLGRRPRDADDESRIIVVAGEDGSAGLIVGDVREVITVAPEQLDRVKVTADPAVTAIAKPRSPAWSSRPRAGPAERRRAGRSSAATALLV